MIKLDILAFGAHPDDVELSCSGTLIKHIKKGDKIGIVDLTAGELGTRGTAAIRKKEAIKAGKIMGVTIRENLNFGDGFFRDDSKHQLEVIKVIRKYQPDIILANAIHDRHPDHGRASKLISESCFLSGLAKIITTENKKKQKEWRPKAVYHYIQDRYINPDFIVDITKNMDNKMKAIKAYNSQFYDPKAKLPQTLISTPEFLDFLCARAMQMGRIIGVKYGEGFNVEKSVGVNYLTDLI